LHKHIEDIILNNEEIAVDNDTVFLFVNSFVGSSFISENGRIRFDCNNKEADLTRPVKGYCWVQKSQWDGFEAEAYSISHEIAHAFSVVPFAKGLKENSLLVSFDGGASTGNFAAFLYKKGQLTQLESHWDLSHLSKLYNDNGLSFALMQAEPGEHCSVPGKLMGFASWGNYNKKIEDWLIENDYFKNAWGDRKDFYERALKDFGWKGNLDNHKDVFLFDVAATMQEIFKKGILEKIISLAKETSTEYLYYAGGCALNIVANAELIQSNIFKDVFISPCCNDSGLSIGASAYWHFINGKELITETPYLNSFGNINDYDYDAEDVEQTAKALADRKVIGICNGFAEAGPRALGNRSILCLADSKVLSQKVSMEIKEREWYRPVAPIMLARNTERFTGLANVHHLAKYMLLDFDILPEYKKEIEGVVHANGTARIQVINKRGDNTFIYDLLTLLEEKYRIRALINTSFNGKDEPIVQTEKDAISSAKRMNLDGLVINGKYINL